MGIFTVPHLARTVPWGRATPGVAMTLLRAATLIRLPAVLTLAGCAAELDPAEEVAAGHGPLGASGVVVNECGTGPSSFIELYNGGPSVVDLAAAGTCWFVDDVAGGGAPKRITDANVTHAPASSTCAAAGRPATCALVAPGEVVWVPYSYVNSTTTDACRLVSSPWLGSACSTSYLDAEVGGPTASSVAGECFGREGNGGVWQPSAVPCTKGESNAGCADRGASCDDGNACTTGETWAADCTCGDGAPVTCDDGNPCTADACDVATGCSPTAVPDGTPCASGSICAAGVCVVAGPPPSDEPVISVAGAPDRLLLRGVVVTETGFFEGEVLTDGENITCVASSCASAVQAMSPGPTVVVTNGIILPGLIDAHNHILFDIFDESDWTPPKLYTNHDQWPNDPKYQAMVDAKQHLNGEYGSSVNVGCELNKYGELKGLIAGTTSIAGAANPANKACYGSLARTIDQSSNDLPGDKIQAATLFPSTAAADGVCRNIANDKTDAYVIHVGEGVDSTALAEFDKLWTVPTTDGCLHARETAIVHGTAFGQAQFALMAQQGMSLVWSPRSNVFLYGGGSDFTKTTNVPLALSFGLNVSIAPDWSIGGSQNLLDELRFANTVDDQAWGDILTPRAIFEMATINAARALGLDHVLGSLTEGKKADLFVIGGDRGAPYDALLGAGPREVRLVMVGGRALYGDASLAALAPAGPACEALPLCGASKFVCVAESGGTATNKLGQTYADIVATLSTELTRYDAMDLSAWDFAPIAPLYACPGS